MLSGVCLSQEYQSEDEQLVGGSPSDENKPGRGRHCDCRRRGLRRGNRAPHGDRDDKDGAEGRRSGPPRPHEQGDRPEGSTDGMKLGPPGQGEPGQGPRPAQGEGPRQGLGGELKQGQRDRQEDQKRGPQRLAGQGEGPNRGSRDEPEGKGMRPQRPGRGSGEPGDGPRRCRCGGRGAHRGPRPQAEQDGPKEAELQVCL